MALPQKGGLFLGAGPLVQKLSKGDTTMKLGVAIASDGALPSAFVVMRGLEQSIEKAAKYGYDGVELALKDPSEITRAELGSLLKKSGIEVSAVSSGQVFAARGLTFTDEDKESREAVYECFKGFIDLASDFGGLVNIGRTRGSIKGRDMGHWEDLFIDMANKVCDYAEPRGVKMILEPVNRYEIDSVNNLDQCVDLVRKVNRKNFTMMPDIFHMNMEDAHMDEALIKYRKYVEYIHLADSNRWAPGFGHMDFDTFFAALGKIHYNGWATVECLPYPDPDTAAKKAVKFLRAKYI